MTMSTFKTDLTTAHLHGDFLAELSMRRKDARHVFRLGPTIPMQPGRPTQRQLLDALCPPAAPPTREQRLAGLKAKMQAMPHGAARIALGRAIRALER